MFLEQSDWHAGYLVCTSYQLGLGAQHTLENSAHVLPRFTSTAAGLDAGCWCELSNHFDTLKHLHANLDSWPKSELPRLETIDIRTYGSSNSFPSKSTFELFLRKEFSKRNSNIRRLHLELAPRYHHVSHVNNHFRQVDVFPELFLSHKISLAHLENLTSLSLGRLPLVHPADVEFPSSWLPDTRHLKKLTLLRCYGAREFLVAFGNACAASQSPLEHLQAEIEWRTGEITSEDVDSCLEPIYRSCGRVTSLHVGWCVPPGEPERLPGVTLAYLQHGGHLLRSFSLHNHTWDHTSEGYGRFEPMFHDPQILLHAFRNCPNLEELAFVTSDSLATDDSESAWEHWKKVRVRRESYLIKYSAPLPPTLLSHVSVRSLPLLARWPVVMSFTSIESANALYSKDSNIFRNCVCFTFASRPG